MVNAYINPKDIYNLVSSIPDPEIPAISIDELGMLREVAYMNGEYIITITPTYTACPAMSLIEQEIKHKLAGIGVRNVKVKQTCVPAWTSDWMNKNTREKLKSYGISPPTYNTCSRLNAGKEKIKCPRCDSADTVVISRFGSTACKGMCKCNSCGEPFEYFKCH
ncbi:MAG: 1,2-phenylacetyl-CoA epoxidase subunit PaaD [Bacteroidia bacterium]